jgi:hypothetical protein
LCTTSTDLLFLFVLWTYKTFDVLSYVLVKQTTCCFLLCRKDFYF